MRVTSATRVGFPIGRGAAILALAFALAGCAGVRGIDAAVTHSAPANAAPADAAPVNAVAQTMVASARAMLGQPYRFGGSAPGGFDCSGLVSFAARRAGVSLPRTAAEQRKSGVPVARARLAAGDLVFMRLTRKDLHVGIALDADRFIHAPAAGGRVRIDSLRTPPYSSGFLEARRVAGLDGSGP